MIDDALRGRDGVREHFEEQKPTAIRSPEGLVNQLHVYVGCELVLNRARARRDQAIQAIQAGYDQAWAQTEKHQKKRFANIQAYCEDNRDRLWPEATKTIKLAGCTLAFAFNPYHVDKVHGRDKWEDIVGRMREESWAQPYLIPQPPELDKQKLLTDRETIAKSLQAELLRAGIQFVQDERFSITPDVESAPPAAATIPQD